MCYSPRCKIHDLKCTIHNKLIRYTLKSHLLADHYKNTNLKECSTGKIKIMDYALKIPEDHPHQEQLQEVINSLLVIVPAEAVYVSQIGENKDSPSFITFILMDNCGQNSEGFQRVSEKIQLDYPYFIFKFLEDGEAAIKFDEGNIYCIRHCNVNHLVYYQEGHTMFYPTTTKPKKIFRQSNKCFNKRRSSHFETFAKATSYLRDGNSVEAAAYLYKSLLRMYCFYLEVLAEDTVDDYVDYFDFKEAYFRITKAFPSLKMQIDLDDQQDREMIDTLNSAHMCILKNETMEDVDNLILERAVQKFDPVEEILAALYYEYLEYGKTLVKDFTKQSFIHESVLAERIASTYFVHDALAQISETITSFIKTSAIYCFGYTTKWLNIGSSKINYTDQVPGYHFYLLLLTGESRENTVPLLQSQIKKLFNNQYTVTILSHRVQYLRRQSHNQQYFFNTVMANGLRAYNDTEHPVYPLKIDMVRDMAFTRNYWKNRMRAAEAFLEMVRNEHDNPHVIILNALLQQAVQQIAMGLLDLFLGYHPNIYSTKYLLRLLGCIPEVQPIFDNSERDRKLLQLLSANIDMLKHNDLDRESIEDSNVLYTRCRDFFDVATKVGTTRMEAAGNLNIECHE